MKIIAAFLWVFLTVQSLYAQDLTPLERVEALGLETKEIGRVTAYFAPADRDRAVELTTLAEAAAAHFERELGMSFKFRIAALTPEHWFSEFPGAPYAIPWVSVSDRLLFVPSSLSEGLLVRGPTALDDRRRIDFVLLHEYGHLADKAFYLTRRDEDYDTVPWFREFLANYFAYAYVHAADPEMAEASKLMWRDVVEGYKPSVMSLEWGFMNALPPGQLAQTYAWYQNMLNLRAAEVYEEYGLDFLRDLNSELPWKEAGEWTTETLLPVLDQVAPGFQAWADTLSNYKRSHIAITPVTVIDVSNGLILPDQTVLVEGDKIATIGAAGKVKVPDDAEVVEAEGKFLIPGLWDMHAHGTSYEREESFFRLFLANGITGFRDPFGSLKAAATARDAVRDGELPGPSRIIAAGNLVDGPPGMVQGSVVASSPAEGRRIVDSLHAEGAPFIKVYFMLAPETYRAIAERTFELGLPIAGHVPILVRAADASDAGQRSIEHMTGVLAGCSTDEEAVLTDWQTVIGLMSDGDVNAFTERYMNPIRRALATQDEGRCRQLLERFVDNETWQVPTLVSLRGKAYLREHDATGDSRTDYFTPPGRWTGGRPFGFPMTDEQWEILQGQYEREKEIVGMMANAGVPLLAGSDTATPWAFPGFGLHDELKLLVEAGLTPLQALQAATLNPARFFEQTEELGTVDEGKLADLVLLDANPLEDISNTQQIRAVVADGRLYLRTDLDRILSEVKALNQQIDE